MAISRSTGLLIGLAFTLAATWYAAGIDAPEDDLLSDTSTAPTTAPRAAREPARAALPVPASAQVAAAEDGAPRMAPAVGDLFGPRSWRPPAPPPTVAAPAPPPSAPPLPFRYVGRMEEDGKVVVFLAEGGADARTRLVRQGDQWPPYRVDEITPQGMRLTYLPLNETQRMLFGSSN